ncbi:MAG: ABC transporter permease [Halioglobus sp.]|nr:ABC transporter permease [Halioglobus sp.]
MLRYVGRRLLLGLLALFGVSLITFVATHLSGEATWLLVPMDASAAEIAAVRARYGLDLPLFQQYVIYLGNVLGGDFGTSIKYRVPVLELVWSRVPATLVLAGTGFLLALATGTALGITAAVHRGSRLDTGVTLFGLVGQAMPGFWVAIMLQLVFAVQLGWLPTGGSGSIPQMVLPVIAVSWFSIAAFMRLTRSAMLDVLGSDYVKLARLKGNPERVVILRHAFRNALIPLVTFAGLNLAALLGGTVVIETIFAWPGIGKLMIDAIGSRDYPVVQAGVLVTATLFILVNLAVDLVYGVLDPRIRHGR